MVQHVQGVQAEDETRRWQADLGLPLSRRRSWLGKAAGRRVRESGRGVADARGRARAAEAAQRAGRADHVERARRGVPRAARSGAAHAREAALAPGERDERVWRRRVVDLRSDQIAAWRTTLPEGHRFEATQALRQLLNRAVAWKIIDSNPAKVGVDNPRGSIRRSVRSSRGRRSTRLPSTSALSTGRSSSSPQPPAFGPANGSRSSSATSTATRGSSTCAGPSRTAG